jgi:hypothetical protein
MVEQYVHSLLGHPWDVRADRIRGASSLGRQSHGQGDALDTGQLFQLILQGLRKRDPR